MENIQAHHTNKHDTEGRTTTACDNWLLNKNKNILNFFNCNEIRTSATINIGTI